MNAAKSAVLGCLQSVVSCPWPVVSSPLSGTSQREPDGSRFLMASIVFKNVSIT